MKKTWCVLHNGISLSHERGWDVIFSNMCGPSDGHIERSKSDREGETPHGIPDTGNLKRNDANELLTKQKETHRLRGQTEGCQGWGEDWGRDN